MSYFDKTELSFAAGYYHIRHGIVSFDENTPKEIIDRFWKAWPKFREKVIERQKQGLLDSRYPILPWDDPQENRKHYESLAQ